MEVVAGKDQSLQADERTAFGFYVSTSTAITTTKIDAKKLLYGLLS
jgi:hypothetical protein